MTALRPQLAPVSQKRVRYNPEGDEALNQRQSACLKRLSDYLHSGSHRLFMFELLVPAEKHSSILSTETRKPMTWSFGQGMGRTEAIAVGITHRLIKPVS